MQEIAAHERSAAGSLSFSARNAAIIAFRAAGSLGISAGALDMVLSTEGAARSP